jgi:hypothetical protein
MAARCIDLPSFVRSFKRVWKLNENVAKELCPPLVDYYLYSVENNVSEETSKEEPSPSEQETEEETEPSEEDVEEEVSLLNDAYIHHLKLVDENGHPIQTVAALSATMPYAWCVWQFTLKGCMCANDPSTNIAESWNSNIVEHRRKEPLPIFLHSIMLAYANNLSRVLEELSKYSRLSNVLVQDKETRTLLRLLDCSQVVGQPNVFLVKEKGSTFTVDLHLRRCTCGFWQASGVPCNHAVALHKRPVEKLRSLLPSYMTYSTVKTAVEKAVAQWQSVGGIDMPQGCDGKQANHTNITLPATLNKKAGRPKVKRFRSRREKLPGRK